MTHSAATFVLPANVSINALVEATKKHRPKLETSANALDTDTNPRITGHPPDSSATRCFDTAFISVAAAMILKMKKDGSDCSIMSRMILTEPVPRKGPTESKRPLREVPAAATMVDIKARLKPMRSKSGPANLCSFHRQGSHLEV